MDHKEHKVNIKARIKRHSKMLEENLLMKDKIINKFKKNNLLSKVIAFLLIFSLPVYPIFASFVHNNNEYDFYRWYIDEDSILWAYELEGSYIDDPNATTSDWFIADTDILDENRDYSWTIIPQEYIVKPWDSISLIASKFWISKATIYNYNSLAKNHILKPWEKLIIPASSGIKYTIKKWDSLLAIANKYKIDKEKILEFNPDLKNWTLKVGQEIFLPWAKEIIENKKIIKTYTKRNYTRKIYTKKSNYVTSNYTNQEWVYKLKRHKPYSWAWWNCTYYVASYKNVDWRWNANQWMTNAAKKGHKVVYWRWFKPMLWAIIVFEGRWYNLRYGHVWIVMELKKDYMIISDMNYRRLNEVTYRKIKYDDPRIVWYIYVD